MYTTLPEQLVNCAILHGNEYNTNNGMVNDVLQSLKLNGPAWTWINAYQVSNDGRNAWKTLLNFYEGDSAKTRSKLYFHCNWPHLKEQFKFCMTDLKHECLKGKRLESR